MGNVVGNVGKEGCQPVKSPDRLITLNAAPTRAIQDS
jgi:hypothetical protein